MNAAFPPCKATNNFPHKHPLHHCPPSPLPYIVWIMYVIWMCTWHMLETVCTTSSSLNDVINHTLFNHLQQGEDKVHVHKQKLSKPHIYRHICRTCFMPRPPNAPCNKGSGQEGRTSLSSCHHAIKHATNHMTALESN